MGFYLRGEEGGGGGEGEGVGEVQGAVRGRFDEGCCGGGGFSVGGERRDRLVFFLLLFLGFRGGILKKLWRRGICAAGKRVKGCGFEEGKKGGEGFQN